MFTAASTTAILTGAFSDTGIILAATIGVVITTMVALMGLGFGVRKLRHYVTGKKF